MPHYRIEISHAPRRVCGVDEAGCGPWAGPVVAAAVLFETRRCIPKGLNDSKQLDKQKRTDLAAALRDKPQLIHIGVGIATVEEIDHLNIWGATALAMARAVAALTTAPGLPQPPDIALVDGKRIPKGLTCEVQTIIGGDATSLSIAAASIIAKTTRDEQMERYAAEFPPYGFERHAGYGTKAHQHALAQHGPCAIHRRSFRPIRELLEQRASA